MALSGTENIPKKIKTFKHIEKEAIYAIEALDNWQLAHACYTNLLELTKGWLSDEDPCVLWIVTHLSETLIKQDRLFEAEHIHTLLLNHFARHVDGEEIQILSEVLHLRVDMANSLFFRQQNELALDILLRALVYSEKHLGTDDDITVGIRDSREKVKRKLDERKQRKESNRINREQRKTLDWSGLNAVASSAKGGASPTRQHPTSAVEQRIDTFTETMPKQFSVDTGSISGAYSVSTPQKSPSRLPRPSHLAERVLNQATASHHKPHSPSVSSAASVVGKRPANKTLSSPPRGGLQLRDITPPPHRNSSPRISDGELLHGSAEQHEVADQWFSEYLKEVHELLDTAGKVLPPYRPKIAILDTGLNTAHGDVKRIYKPSDRNRNDKRIYGLWKPTDTKWNEKEDTAGHGTHCAMVAHQVAPDANIYVLRVFEDENHVTGKYVAEAIEHAVTKFQVDIISMSFAIEDDRYKPDISAMLNKHKDKVLFFAAASNSGENQGRKYPATCDEVFAIHAADGGGATRYGRNPKAYKDDHNYTTLGLYVSAAYKDQSTERMSGTSVACPIAAGIAALVLEFCRQDPIQLSQKHLDLLKTRKGMNIILSGMWSRQSREAKPEMGQYFYLQPWRFMSLSIAGRSRDAVTARRKIAKEIVWRLDGLEEGLLTTMLGG